jgi:uncharacterized protein YdeI (YjbR/CyaY-like superfamily)
MNEPIYFSSPDQFRAWLEQHHESEAEVWVGMWKNGTGKPSLTWSQAVDEALCFGWIDGKLQSVDDERHIQRFTPRKPASNWSAVNIAKIERLRAAGLMHAAGEAAFAKRRADRTGVYSFEQAAPAELSAEQRARLDADTAAAAFFDGQPPGYRRTAIHWVTSAKKPETRERRLATLIADSAAGRRLRHLSRP